MPKRLKLAMLLVVLLLCYSVELRAFNPALTVCGICLSGCSWQAQYCNRAGIEGFETCMSKYELCVDVCNISSCYGV